MTPRINLAVLQPWRMSPAGKPQAPRETEAMPLRGILIASLVFTVLTLVPAGAHLLSLANKISMSSADYLVAQQAYAGWNLTAIAVLGALISTGLLAWSARDQPLISTLAWLAFGCMAATQVAFWTLNFPGNQQTSNWTHLPANWEWLRLRWELGHALSCLLNLAALAALLTANWRLLR